MSEPKWEEWGIGHEFEKDSDVFLQCLILMQCLFGDDCVRLYFSGMYQIQCDANAIDVEQAKKVLCAYFQSVRAIQGGRK